MFKLKNIKLPQKFIILGAFLLLVAAVPTTLYVKNVTSELDVAEREVAATTPILALQGVIQFTQQHRGVAAGMLNGNESLAGRLPGIQAELNKRIELVNVSLKEASISPQIVSLWDTHKQRLNAIEQAVANRSLNSTQSTVQHTQLIAELLLVKEKIQDLSGLSLDSVAGTNFLIKATMVSAPKLAENMGQMRAMGTGYLAAGTLSAEDRAKLTGLYSNVAVYFSDLIRNVEKATNADEKIKVALETKANEIKTQIDKTLAITNQNLLNAQELKLPANQFFDEYTNTINSLYTFNALATESLVSTLNTRVTDLQQSLYLVFGLMLCALIATLIVAVVFIRSITVPMRESIKVANAVASGDFSSRIDTESSDETGQMFQALQKMNEKLAKENLLWLDYKGQLAAVSRLQAVIEFKMDGTIITANDNFLSTLGYTLEEIKDRHHSMFV
nr:nitrate- and nitrite sensing domain-containing protein [Betaproteobacteria bacterium]